MMGALSFLPLAQIEATAPARELQFGSRTVPTVEQKEGHLVVSAETALVAAHAATRCSYATGTDVTYGAYASYYLYYNASCILVEEYGWHLRHSYQNTGPDNLYNVSGGIVQDIDTMNYYTKGDQCLVAFAGSDEITELAPDSPDLAMIADFVRAPNDMPQLGNNVSRLALKELQGILEVIIAKDGSLPAAFSSCDSLVISGHSLGAAMAALFGAFAVQDASFLGLPKDKISNQLFAPFPVVLGVPHFGCLPGHLYYTLLLKENTGDVAIHVDMVDANVLPVIEDTYHVPIEKQALSIDATTYSFGSFGGNATLGPLTACEDVVALFHTIAANETQLGLAYSLMYDAVFIMHDNYVNAIKALFHQIM